MEPTVVQLINDPRDGRLPALLLVMTVVTGLVDAVSILKLGRVFVANMTGNVVFIGFAVARAPGFSLDASLVALAGFLAGAGLGGPMAGRLGSNRNRLLALAAGVEVTLIGIAGVVAAVVAMPFSAAPRDVIAALLALAMGMQNSVARSLAVPDLTTTVLTMALTGVAAEFRMRATPALSRRLLSVAAMFSGAVIGALLVIHGQTPWALAASAALLLTVGALARSTLRAGGHTVTP